MGQFPDIVIDQDNICGIHGNVTSYAAHGNSRMRGFQGKGIIDSVSNHAHTVPLLLARVNPVEFVLRQAFRANQVNPQLSGDTRGGIPMVPGQQYGNHSGIPYFPDGSYGILPQGIRQGDQPCGLPVHSYENHGAPLLLIPFRRTSGLIGQLHPVFPEQFQVAGQKFLSLRHSPYSPAGNHAELFRLGKFPH